MNDKWSEQSSGKPSLPTGAMSVNGGMRKTNDTNDERQMPDLNLFADAETQSEAFLRAILRIIMFDYSEQDVTWKPVGYLGRRFFIRATPNDSALLKGGCIQGLQAILAVIGRRKRRNISAEVDELNAKPGVRTNFQAEILDNWPKEEFQKTVEYILSAAFEEFAVSITDLHNGKSSLQIFLSEKESEDAASYVGGRIKSLLKTVGYRFNRKIDVAIERDQMLYEQVSMEATPVTNRKNSLIL